MAQFTPAQSIQGYGIMHMNMHRPRHHHHHSTNESTVYDWYMHVTISSTYWYNR